MYKFPTKGKVIYMRKSSRKKVLDQKRQQKITTIKAAAVADEGTVAETAAVEAAPVEGVVAEIVVVDAPVAGGCSC